MIYLVADPSTADFNESSDVIFKQGESTALSFFVSLINSATAASGNDILAVSGTDVNFDVQLQLSDVDISVAADTLGLSPITPNIDTAELQVALAAGGSVSQILTGTATVTIDAAVCTDVQYLCAVLSEGVNASYTDADNSSASNIACEDISTRKTCEPGRYES